MKQLSQYDVTEIYKMKARAREDNGVLECTGTILLTFNRCKLPETEKIGWNFLEVCEYIPIPVKKVR